VSNPHRDLSDDQIVRDATYQEHQGSFIAEMMRRLKDVTAEQAKASESLGTKLVSAQSAANRLTIAVGIMTAVQALAAFVYLLITFGVIGR
jgi:hypothetical protein